jgi:hypothetical protein
MSTVSGGPYIKKDLIGYWSLNGNSNDLVGGNNGTDTAISYVSGKVGQGASFNGSSSQISIPYKTIFDFTDGSNDLPFSFSFWLYNSGGNNLQWIISKRTQNNSWQITMFNKQLGVAFFTTNSNYINNTTVNTISDNVWTHVSITYNGNKTNNGILIYFNSILQNITTGNVGNYTGMAIEFQNVVIGNALIGGSYYLNGNLDEVTMWSRVLTQSEINGLYNNGNGLSLRV